MVTWGSPNGEQKPFLTWKTCNFLAPRSPMEIPSSTSCLTLALEKLLISGCCSHCSIEDVFPCHVVTGEPGQASGWRAPCFRRIWAACPLNEGNGSCKGRLGLLGMVDVCSKKLGLHCKNSIIPLMNLCFPVQNWSIAIFSHRQSGSYSFIFVVAYGEDGAKNGLQLLGCNRFIIHSSRRRIPIHSW